MNSGGPGGYPTKVRRPQTGATRNSSSPQQPGVGSGGGGGTGGADPCNLRFEARLNDPQIPVVNLMVVNSCLDIQLRQVDGNPVIQVLFRGQHAGTISITPALGQFAQCLADGVSYKGTVVALNRPGYVKMKVERGTCS